MLVFEIVTVVVCVVSAVIAAVSFVRGLKLYDKIGQRPVQARLRTTRRGHH